MNVLINKQDIVSLTKLINPDIAKLISDRVNITDTIDVSYKGVKISLDIYSTEDSNIELNIKSISVLGIGISWLSRKMAGELMIDYLSKLNFLIAKKYSN